MKQGKTEEGIELMKKVSENVQKGIRRATSAELSGYGLNVLRSLRPLHIHLKSACR
jgi:hypothetical protein